MKVPFLVLSLALAQTSLAQGPGSESIEKAVTAVYPALVRIAVVMEEGEEGRMRKMQGVGSGSIISPDGYVLTNHHVAGRGTRFQCTLSNREVIDATLVGTDVLADLAVIKLDLAGRRDPKAPVPVARFGNSDKLRIGDVVLAMGCPGGLSQSVTKGIVANTEMIAPKNMAGMSLDGEDVGELVRWIGHDAIIFGGNSGGPLVNLDGEIVGINEVGIASLGGAIPANLAKAVSAELIAKGQVTRSWIGLEPQPLLRSMEKARGLLVASVFEGSPAALAGIEPGDVVQEFQGQPVPDCFAPEDLPIFNAMVLNTPVGTKVTIRGTRAGKPMDWSLATVARDALQAREAELPRWGLTARNLTRIAALERRRKDTNGVIVDTVSNGGAAAEAKPALRAGDVISSFNGQPVSDCSSLLAATQAFLKGLKSAQPAMVGFERGNEELLTVIRLGPDTEEQKARQAEKAWLGAQVQVIGPDLAAAMKLPEEKGVRITAVAPNSPAQKAGFKTGDLLFKANGQVINASRPEDQSVFETLIRSLDVDDKVEFDAQRSGQPIKLAATLGKRPAGEGDGRRFKDDRFEFSVRDLTAARLVQAGHGPDLKGVLVDDVIGSGWAALGGLRSSDILLKIDGEPVPDVGSLKRKLAQLAEAKPRRVVFFIQRGIRNYSLELEPRW